MSTNMERNSDQRQYQRVKRQFIVRFRIKSDDSSEDDFSQWNVITCQDLSGGGMLLNFNREIQPGTLLDMEMKFALLSNPIKCVGKVLRVDKTRDSPICRIAIIFSRIDEKDKETLDNIVRRIKK